MIKVGVRCGTIGISSKMVWAHLNQIPIGFFFSFQICFVTLVLLGIAWAMPAIEEYQEKVEAIPIVAKIQPTSNGPKIATNPSDVSSLLLQTDDENKEALEPAEYGWGGYRRRWGGMLNRTNPTQFQIKPHKFIISFFRIWRWMGRIWPGLWGLWWLGLERRLWQTMGRLLLVIIPKWTFIRSTAFYPIHFITCTITLDAFRENLFLEWSAAIKIERNQLMMCFFFLID